MNRVNDLVTTSFARIPWSHQVPDDSALSVAIGYLQTRGQSDPQFLTKEHHIFVNGVPDSLTPAEMLQRLQALRGGTPQVKTDASPLDDKGNLILNPWTSVVGAMEGTPTQVTASMYWTNFTVVDADQSVKVDGPGGITTTFTSAAQTPIPGPGNLGTVGSVIWPCGTVTATTTHHIWSFWSNDSWASTYDSDVISCVE